MSERPGCFLSWPRQQVHLLTQSRGETAPGYPGSKYSRRQTEGSRQFIRLTPSFCTSEANPPQRTDKGCYVIVSSVNAFEYFLSEGLKAYIFPLVHRVIGGPTLDFLNKCYVLNIFAKTYYVSERGF